MWAFLFLLADIHLSCVCFYLKGYTQMDIICSLSSSHAWFLSILIDNIDEENGRYRKSLSDYREVFCGRARIRAFSKMMILATFFKRVLNVNAFIAVT